MSKAVAATADQPTKLAQWTRLSDARFGDCYVSVCQPGARSWKVIVAHAADTLKLEACREADSCGFLGELALAIANWESQVGRASEEIQAMLAGVRGYGLLHGMTNQQKGFMDARILMPLMQACDASAVVFDRRSGQRHGTAFLVRPDLVLTAAHVVLKESPEGKQWLNELKEQLGFRFKARPNQPSTTSVEILAADDKPLVSSLPPHGTPPNLLDPNLNGTAGKRLDFALVRLAQRVDHLLPVLISDDVAVERGKPCWAFGFPGGDALMMDVDVVTEVHNDSGRWLHKANAASGMSGGCCVNHEGHVAGLHEGGIAIQQAGKETWLNRGVSMAAIRKAQRVNGRDPLNESASTPGLELQDATAVAELYQAGKALAGAEWRERWQALVTGVLGTDPESQPVLPTFHPWFAQRDVESWIDNPDPDMRLCLIYGDRGVGKSFCARILREKLGSRIADLFAFNPTQLGAMSWADAISPIVVPEVSNHRTDAASIRYRDFQEVIDEVQHRAGNGSRTSHVVMDFGSPGEHKRFASTQWMELIAALLAAEGVRVMVIGLDELDRSALIDRLDVRAETETVAQAAAQLEIKHLRKDEFRTFIKSLAKARGRAEPPNLRQIIDGVYDPRAKVRDLLTVMAALAAIKFEGSTS